MLKKLDAYIIRKYLGTFFFVVLIFTLISVVIDIGERIEKLIESELPLETIITQYYLPFVPWINGILWPLYALIAVIFFTSRMANDSEILTTFNAGISLYRLMVPFLVAASILAGIQLAGNHYFLPKASKVRLGFYNKYISRSKAISNTRNIHLFLNPNSKAYINYYNKRDSIGHHFRIEEYKDGEVRYILKATRIKLKQPPNLWTLRNYEERIIDNRGHDLIIHKKETLDTTLNLYHDDFLRYENENEMLTTGELLRFMGKEKSRGIGNAKSMLISLHKRSSEPFSLLILTVIGMSVASRKNRGGMGLNIALGMIIGAIFIVLTRFTETISLNQNMPAWIGVWLPNIVFAAVAILLVAKSQK